MKGSIARLEATPSSHDRIGSRRDELVRGGVLKLGFNGYSFERDYVFASPSAAAVVVTGSSANGWIEWKNAKGETLDEVDRQGVEVEG